ncbi:MAG: NAD-dependent epimerase/dehydratase family protein [Gammaproteobacteria bacterium]
MRIAVSGATGFIGTHLVPYLRARGHTVVTIGRRDFTDNLREKLLECEAFIHLAGLTHVGAPAVHELEATNFALTLAAAEAARDAHVPRFLFVSTINVVAGNRGVLRPDDPINPKSEYGATKAKAEAALLSLPGIEMVVLRPPLVYGPGAKGNLERLTRLCLTGLPLPFGCVENRRSMVSITNLESVLLFLAEAPSVSVDGKIFHVADGRPLSLREIALTIRRAASLPPRLVPVPVAPMKSALALAGRSYLATLLFDDLLVDADALSAIGWEPVPFEEADLGAMAVSQLGRR